VLVLLLLGSLVLTACGGGDDGDAANGGGADAGQDAGEGQDGGDGAAIGTIDAARCAEVVAAMAAASAGVPQAVSGGATDLAASIEQLEAFSAAAPEEIRDDMLIIAEGYAVVAEALAEADYDPASGEVPPPEVIAALSAASEELQAEEFRAASERVNAWFEQECGA
jgi:hypothetical protein